MSDNIALHKHLGLTFDPPADGVAVVRMPVAPAAFGFSANLHGGAIATMVDLACALACVGGSDFDPATHSLVTTDMHVRYLGKARTDQVIARAEVVRAGKQLVVVDCKVRDESDHLIASADFSMMIVALRNREGPDI